MYVTLEQLDAYMPRDLIVQALDDDQDGVVDTAVWDRVAAAVDAAINGPLSKRYTTPLAAPYPAVVLGAAIVLACETLYIRRGVPPDQNPFTVRAASARQELAAIGSGSEPLTAETPRTKPSGIALTEASQLGERDHHLN